MFEKIKDFLSNSNSNNGYKPFNMILCKNELHERICKCSCHTSPGMLHIVACCHIEKCPDCKKNINIKRKS